MSHNEHPPGWVREAYQELLTKTGKQLGDVIVEVRWRFSGHGLTMCLHMDDLTGRPVERVEPVRGLPIINDPASLLSPAPNRRENSQPNAQSDARLTPLMRRVLAVLTTELQSMNRLANLVDHDNDSHFGKCVRRLVRLGYALRVGYAYRLPDACAP